MNKKLVFVTMLFALAANTLYVTQAHAFAGPDGPPIVLTTPDGGGAVVKSWKKIFPARSHTIQQ